MSLILDALRRADSERERGTVPGLNAQPEPVATSEPERRAAPRTEPWVWMGAGVGIGLVVVLGAYVFGRDAALQEGSTRPSAAAVAEPAAPATPALAAPGAAPAASAASAASPSASAPASAAPASAAPAMAAAAVQPVAEPAPWPTADARSDARTDARKPAAKAGTPPPATDPAAARTQLAAGPPVLPLDQLPANLRAQLPALAFGGSMYSSNPANRSLIINGQIHRENDRIAGELTLLEIRPRGAVFGFKGQRFEVPY